MGVRTIRDQESLQGKKFRRLYEPVLLVEALTQGYRKYFPGRIVKPEVYSKRLTSKEDLFKKFVYKLAHVCSNERGGDAVATAAVFQRGQSIVYALAYNSISEKQGQNVIEHVQSLLEIVDCRKNDRSLRRKKQDVLRAILLFNKPRIKIYLRNLVDCMVDYQKQPNKDEVVAKALTELATSLGGDPRGDGTDKDYIDACYRCLDQIRITRGSTIARLCRLVASHDVDHRSEPDAKSWVELPHLISRLYSYEEAMTCFFDAYREWPELFKQPEVRVLPSRKPSPGRLGSKSYSAEGIVGRMTSDETMKAKLLSFVEDLCNFNIDARLRNKTDGFKPVIHSEVLLYDWVRNSKEAQGLRFFKDWEFLGASKPTCRLCKYYIESANAVEAKLRDLRPIEVRPSHDNVYLNWGFPDAHGSPTTVAGTVWQQTYNGMITRVRTDAFRMLEQKSCSGKRHDSNTYDGWSTRASQVGGGDEANLTGPVALLSDRFSQGLRFRKERIRPMTLNDSEDEADGGAML